ncbi:MAG TPA: hypothetical protein VGM82_13040 [Gemmatimonadaceae bacterium]|jgi:hypothetical protein
MGEIKTGKPDIDIETSSHTRGTAEGNKPGNYGKMQGHLPDGRSKAFRSTGINADDKNPIDPAMPNLSPA